MNELSHFCINCNIDEWLFMRNGKINEMRTIIGKFTFYISGDQFFFFS